MFERFSDRARKVMAVANQQAQRFNHEHIGPEHIALALVKDDTGIGASALHGMGVDPRKVRLEVEKLIKSGSDVITMGKLPQTPKAKLVIEKAIAHAREMNHNYVGTEHILLGLIGEPETIPAQVFSALGVTAEKAKNQIEAMLNAPADDKPAAGISPLLMDEGRRILAAMLRQLASELETPRAVVAWAITAQVPQAPTANADPSPEAAGERG